MEEDSKTDGVEGDQNSPAPPKKKAMKLEVPDTYALIMAFVVLSAILTYVVPAGEYTTLIDADTGRQVIDPRTFKTVTPSPVGLMDLLLAIPKGLVDAASIIFMVFLVGGCFHVINQTGAIDAAIAAVIEKFKNRALWIIPLLMVPLSYLGAAGMMVNSVIAFIPVGMALAKRLRLDPVAGAAIMYLGAYSGFASSPLSPVTLGVAQGIAGLKVFSGFGVRCVVWGCLFVSTVLYILRYAHRVRRDPSCSVLDEVKFPDEFTSVEPPAFVFRHFLIIMTFVTGFGLYIYGSSRYAWDAGDLGAIMIAVGVLCGFFGQMGPNQISRAFIVGCKNMVYGALVIGFAKAITIVLEQGNIIHTVIHYLTRPLIEMGAVVSAVGMFWANLIFNFFVPSGSGQAMIVMPLMAPMADIVGVGRQIAVSAYEMGDGMANIIIPTSGVLMSILSMSEIPYSKWLRWVAPIFAIWVGIGTLFIIIAALAEWS